MPFYFRASQHYVNFYLYFYSLTKPIKTEIRNAVHGLFGVCCCVPVMFKVKILDLKNYLHQKEFFLLASCKLGKLASLLACWACYRCFRQTWDSLSCSLPPLSLSRQKMKFHYFDPLP